jgi:NAD+ synthase (glutamine-hydrolysing)
MKIAIAQINCTVGDFTSNTARILDAVSQAKNGGAALVITPELALTGYPPEDLLLRDDFRAACEDTLTGLARKIKGIALLVGHPHTAGKRCCNAASLIQDGRIIMTYCKHVLPDNNTFNEQHYFDAGSQSGIFDLEGVRFAVGICADIWSEKTAIDARQAGAAVLLVLNASPYHTDKQAARYRVVAQQAVSSGISIVCTNLTGGQDDLIFDGASFVVNDKGNITHQLPDFTETIGIIELRDGVPVPGTIAPPQTVEASIYQALCLGLKDYVARNRFPGVLLGMSGGVDSALTLAIAVDVLGADKVWAVMMPSPYTADISLEDSRAMVAALGVRYTELPIEPLCNRFLETLSDTFDGLPADTTEENLQARVRGVLLMALSNKYGPLVVTTGNKSEMATGYCTLYGDMAGGFALLKDVYKTLVYRLCHYRNSLGRVIPKRIIERAPSAELRPDQTDQDSLPPYEILDAIIEAYVENTLSVRQIISKGYAEPVVHRIVHLIHSAEYKRRQSPVGPRITRRSFGKDWRYPLTYKYQTDH